MEAAKRHARKFSFWRFMLILAGLGILLWSGWEDRDASGATILGFLSASALTMLLLSMRPVESHAASPRAALAGALTGATTSLIASGLMIFKDLRHAHPFPDFPPAMILGMLERLPHWALAGALAGIGLRLLLHRDQDRRRLPGD